MRAKTLFYLEIKQINTAYKPEFWKLLWLWTFTTQHLLMALPRGGGGIAVQTSSLWHHCLTVWGLRELEKKKKKKQPFYQMAPLPKHYISSRIWKQVRELAAISLQLTIGCNYWCLSLQPTLGFHLFSTYTVEEVLFGDSLLAIHIFKWWIVSLPSKVSLKGKQLFSGHKKEYLCCLEIHLG